MRLPLLFLAAAASAQVAPAVAPKPWIAMVDAQVGREAKISRAGSLEGAYRRSRTGFELINEGPNHALDLEYYTYQHKMSGPLAADEERAYRDTDDLILSGFVQSELANGNHLQLIGAVEWAAASELDLADGFRWGLGGAYRWKRTGEWDVALGLMVQDRFEANPLPVPYLRAYWHVAPDLRIEFRGTGLQNGIFARWFVTADQSTSLDASVAYETLTFRLADSLEGPRGVAIGEVPIRIGITQFFEPSGTWFARFALSYDAFHRQSIRRDNETVAAFQADGTATATFRIGARF